MWSTWVNVFRWVEIRWLIRLNLSVNSIMNQETESNKKVITKHTLTFYWNIIDYEFNCWVVERLSLFQLLRFVTVSLCLLIAERGRLIRQETWDHELIQLSNVCGAFSSVCLLVWFHNTNCCSHDSITPERSTVFVWVKVSDLAWKKADYIVKDNAGKDGMLELKLPVAAGRLSSD